MQPTNGSNATMGEMILSSIPVRKDEQPKAMQVTTRRKLIGLPRVAECGITGPPIPSMRCTTPKEGLLSDFNSVDSTSTIFVCTTVEGTCIAIDQGIPQKRVIVDHCPNPSEGDTSQAAAFPMLPVPSYHV